MGWLPRLIGVLVRAVAGWLTPWLRRCVPVYEPQAWNDDPAICGKNNCYNYACNIRTDTYAQPGRAAGKRRRSKDCAGYGDAARADGLAAINSWESCGWGACCHKVALTVWPDWDHHWYRLDRDGTWSHKVGWGVARNYDESHNVITDPRTADRGGYTDFCGFFCVCKGRVSIN